jgi:hypothetical protein
VSLLRLCENKQVKYGLWICRAHGLAFVAEGLGALPEKSSASFIAMNKACNNVCMNSFLNKFAVID